MRLGVIEGFYGPLWDDRSRLDLAECLAAAGYTFWHYAPKADPSIRAGWRSPWPEARREALSAFARRCRRLGMEFGIGLTPLGMTADPAPDDWSALAARLVELDAIGVDTLLLGFDDTRGDRADLAAQQARLVEWAAGRTRARRVAVCPTYYSDDPLLDRLFGARPPGYLRALGAALDPGIEVYWAGEEICPREIGVGPVERVAETLGRPPLLWDNYPVNDSPRMCEHLHLRAFTGRPAALADHLAGHAINPALQPRLTAIPALTLPQRYRLGDGFAYAAALREAAHAVLGDRLAATVLEDLEALEDLGRDRLGPRADELRARYAAFDHPAAREIVHWLDGGFRPEEAAPGDGAG